LPGSIEPGHTHWKDEAWRHALGILAAQPDLLEEATMLPSDPEEEGMLATVRVMEGVHEGRRQKGAFHARLWRDGEPCRVVCDDSIPCTEGKPLLTRNKNPGEQWVLALSKAYAKLWGGFEALTGSSIEVYLHDLTGGNATRVPLTGEIDVYSALAPLWQNHCKAAAGALAGHHASDGLAKNTYYGIVRALEVVEGGEPLQLVQMRSMDGGHVWSGPYSASSMSVGVKKQVGLQPGDKLTFWITPKDFVRNFTEV